MRLLQAENFSKINPRSLQQESGGRKTRPDQNRRMNDYERIASAIRFLNEHSTQQPSLTELADHLGLSPWHFHRLFVRWAGITPKDFLQAVTLRHAKAALRAGESVLDAALDTGLSGPGRLHDLCVSMEAASPGEIKARGAGMDIVAGVVDSPFGPCLIGNCHRGICHLSFLGDHAAPDPLHQIRAQWPHATLRECPKKAEALAAEIFALPDTKTSRSALRVFTKGSPFETKIWRALLKIPEGTVVSYGALAKAAGSPGASRAVGAAVGKNAIGYLIPCHRVILSTGVIHAYRWGTERKKAILAREFALEA
jgi:AraC family transcriptional regulator of adaptative response/methylated-DNA-[protein]-cysteine methyltransferase